MTSNVPQRGRDENAFADAEEGELTVEEKSGILAGRKCPESLEKEMGRRKPISQTRRYYS